MKDWARNGQAGEVDSVDGAPEKERLVAVAVVMLDGAMLALAVEVAAAVVAADVVGGKAARNIKSEVLKT